MWVKLTNIEKEEKHTMKWPNGRSMFTVQVSERVFKLKKNPIYENNSKLIKLLRSVAPESSEPSADEGIQ